MKKLMAPLAALLLSLSTSATALMTGTGDVKHDTYKGSRDRKYTVYVPKSYNGSTPVPMIFALHGCAMDHNDARSLWNLDLIADQNNVIVVFPFVTSFTEMRNTNCWGYWFDNHVQQGGGGEVDDIQGIARTIETRYNIDPERRYITGISSGGAMAVAAAIAYNEYWAAVAPVEALAYGDGSSSVLSDQFYSLEHHINKINAELDHTHPVPTLVIHSANDTVVLPRGMELIRDSHLSVWGADLAPDGTPEDCTHEGISCTLTTYNGANGRPLVQTLYYYGLPAKSASYGNGHYWTGDDEDQEKWAKEKGPSASQHIWAFFDRVTFSNGYGLPPGCNNDATAPAAPTGLAAVDVHDKYAVLTVNANGESDLKGYKIYKSDGTALTSSAVASTSITASGLTPQTQYQVYATAVDNCLNESGASSSVSFTTTPLEYVAPSVSGTCTQHYNAGRLDTNGYIACGNEHGYMASVTLWQLQDGSWVDEDPNGGNIGGDTVRPVITLNGGASMTLNQGDSFTDPGAKASDNVDGDISSRIVVSGSVDTNTPGTYTLRYNVSDAAGNAANTVTRTVTVNTLGGGQCEDYTTYNYYHKTAGRAYSSGSYWSPSYYAKGSDEPMAGSTWGRTTLRSTDGSVWQVGNCP